VAVLVNDAGDHVALDLGTKFEVRTADGAVVKRGKKLLHAPVVLGAASVRGDADDVALGDGPPRKHVPTAGKDADRVWALQVGVNDAVFVVERGASPFMRSARLPNGARFEVADASPVSMEVSAGRFSGDAPGTYSNDRVASFKGVGCGAIGADGHVVLALADGRFFVLDPAQGPARGAMQTVVSSTLDFFPTDLSVVDGGFAVLSASRTGSVVHMLDVHGEVAWEAGVPFTVDAPPIDAGGGRVYLAGAGFAALEGGKVLFAETSTRRVLATSLGDGSALVAVGPELRATRRDGAVVQTLRIPEGDAIVTPPAVTADGTAWVATAKALYVAR
jgi:outer membrane protein assembly factor BamB